MKENNESYVWKNNKSECKSNDLEDNELKCSNFCDSMSEISQLLKDKGFKEGYDKGKEDMIEEIVLSRDYKHLPTNFNARVVSYRCEMSQGIMVGIGTDIDKDGEMFFKYLISDEELMRDNIETIMDELFAKSLIDHILNNTVTKNSIELLIKDIYDTQHMITRGT